ncbi:MAG: hypothetical protein GY705_01615 [Bacteroidetes bacterium]|nr:hypothetical protein [Bacteroidota bacterium]
MLREEVFTPYAQQAEQFLKKGNLLDGLKVLLAIYEGHNNVYEPEEDEASVMEEYNDTCLDIFKEILKDALYYISQTIKIEAAVMQIFDLIVERVLYWNDNYDESLKKNDWEDGNVVYDLKLFESLFLSLLMNSKVAMYLEELLLKHDLKNQETSKVFLGIFSIKRKSKRLGKNIRSLCVQRCQHYAATVGELSKGRKRERPIPHCQRSFQSFFR